MKDGLILLCIGVIAFLLFQERGRWASQQTTVTAPTPGGEIPIPTHPRAETAGSNLPPPGTPPPPNLPERDALANLVIESQRAALAKYPALGVPNSELNIRFTHRYKNLVADHSPRLQDPGWPVQLADECARDAGLQPAAPSATPPPAAPARKTFAQPVSLTAPTVIPAPSLRVPQPAAAVPQTLVFHPAPGGTLQVPPATAPASANIAKPPGALPFVTLDAVNQSSGNNYTYNYNSYWWYDISFRQSVDIAINVRNMSRESAAVNLRWLFFARQGSTAVTASYSAQEARNSTSPRGRAWMFPPLLPLFRAVR